MSLHVTAASRWPLATSRCLAGCGGMLVLLAMIVGGVNTQDPPTVDMGLIGKVQGYRRNVHDVDIDTYLGIPFAEPPVGIRRFQRPEQKRPWNGTLDATTRPNSCFQVVDRAFLQKDRTMFPGVDMWNPNTPMSEDCLYLNVWAPATESESPRTVMVWIYGGGFFAGTSTLDLYDGSILAATQDVIVVSMQYRIGVLGFMYMGNGGAPGNQGMVDQTLAMQWVRNHIHNFNGDPEKITIFGESAGAASVSLHLISKLSRDTFKYAIMQSGSALGPWVFESQAEAKERAYSMAEMSNCTAAHGYTEDNKVIACMREQDPVTLTLNMWSLTGDYNSLTPSHITIDNYFLKKDPATMVKEGDFKRTNILLGAVKDEGAYFLVYGLPRLFYETTNKANVSVEDFMDVVEGLSWTTDKSIHELINFEYNIPRDYEKERELPRHILDDMMGDAEFICPVVEFATKYAQRNQIVYMYHYLHRTSANPWPEWMGTMHGYEIDSVFGIPLNETYNYSEDEKELSRKVMQYWANFSKYGNPNGQGVSGKWTKYTKANKGYMTIDDSEMKMRRGLRHRACQFWQDILPRLRKTIHKTGGTPAVSHVHSTSSHSSYTSSLLLTSTFYALAYHLYYL